jgi:hypothetical protein
MLSRTFLNRRRICAVLSILAGSFLIANLFCAAAHFQMWIFLNNVCRQKVKNHASPLLFRYPDLPQWTRLDQACDQYLKSYFISLAAVGGAQVRSAQVYENQVDSLVPGKKFSQCMDRLNDRTWFFENVLGLPYLAEACERCAVSQCRRHAEAAKTNYQNNLSTAKAAQAAELSQSYILLANETEELAKLFCRHDKFEIAERSYQDAIASATFAAGDDAEGNLDARNTQRYYLAYVAFLYTHHREEEALSILATMNQVCRSD